MTNTAEQVVLVQIRVGVLVVRSDGTIWRCQTRTRTGRLRTITPKLAEHERPDGYRRVRVGMGGREYNASAHRVVWMVSNGDIPAGLEINHRDGNRGNNAITNLELVTKSENLLHSYRVLDRWRPTGERCKRGRLTSEQVDEIRRRGTAGEGQRPLAREFGVTHRAIRLVLTGQTWRDQYPERAA